MELDVSQMQNHFTEPSAPSPTDESLATDDDSSCMPGDFAARAPHFQPPSPPREAVVQSMSKKTPKSDKKKKGSHDPTNTRTRRHYFKVTVDTAAESHS